MEAAGPERDLGAMSPGATTYLVVVKRSPLAFGWLES